jgi:hypothetical protein
MATKKQTKVPVKQPSAKQAKLGSDAQKRLKILQSKIAAQNKAKAKAKAKVAVAKTPTKKPIAPKATKVKVVTTKEQISELVNQSDAVREHKLAVWKETEVANDLALNDWAQRLTSTKNKMEKLKEIVERITTKLLDEAYSVYSEVIKSELADDFFGALWNQLRKDGIKVQSNTPSASLVIRYICGPTISTKTISNYAKVLEGADYNNIKTEQFIDWLNHKTMTRVIEDQRNIESNVETRAEKMARARILVMRIIEAREKIPEFSWTTTNWQAEQEISEQGLWIGIGNAYRILDGGHNFNASMNLILRLPINIEMERHILNIYAKTIVDAVDYWEEKMNGIDREVWADKLWEQIVSAGFEEADKSNEKWSNRQQAARYENQQEFNKFVKEKKK